MTTLTDAEIDAIEEASIAVWSVPLKRILAKIVARERRRKHDELLRDRIERAEAIG